VAIPVPVSVSPSVSAAFSGDEEDDPDHQDGKADRPQNAEGGDQQDRTKHDHHLDSAPFFTRFWSASRSDHRLPASPLSFLPGPREIEVVSRRQALPPNTATPCHTPGRRVSGQL
jgi:hypothetical protein